MPTRNDLCLPRGQNLSELRSNLFATAGDFAHSTRYAALAWETPMRERRSYFPNQALEN
jgi:hypothetical protein